MKRALSLTNATPAEREAETESNRLIEQIEGALAAVAERSPAEADALDNFADRIERAARDLAFAIRELARERRLANEQTA